jgi:hypothetical protein
MRHARMCMDQTRAAAATRASTRAATCARFYNAVEWFEANCLGWKLPREPDGMPMYKQMALFYPEEHAYTFDAYRCARACVCVCFSRFCDSCACLAVFCGTSQAQETHLAPRTTASVRAHTCAAPVLVPHVTLLCNYITQPTGTR